MTINKATKEENNFMNNIRDFVHEGRLDSALALCKNNSTPLARMIEKVSENWKTFERYKHCH